MPIATVNPIVEFEPKPVLPVASPDNYMGLTYDNNQTPVVSLAAYAEGAPWTVTYFRQVIGDHNDLKALDSNLAPQYQSYGRIDQLELRVQRDLESTTTADQHLTKTEGSAFVYAFIVPNVNDYFIADTSYQRKALFRVTTVNRQTWRRESVHTVEYTLMDYVDNLPQEIASLELKTTTTYVFSRDRLLEGLTPYLKTEDYHLVNSLQDERKLIGDYYLSAFSNHSMKTLMFPGQPLKRIYDNFLVNFVMSTFGYLEFTDVLKIKQLPTDGDQYLAQPQFWTAILERDRNQLTYGNHRMMVTSTAGFLKNTYLKTLYSARCDCIVYPYKPDLSTMSGEDMPPKPVFRGCLKETTNAQGKEITDAEKTILILDKPVLLYPKANEDAYYVLSENFYNNDREKMTLLELMTSDYLDSKTLDLKQLTALVRFYPKMERMEQFYFGPLIMCLMRYANHRTY